MSSSRIEQIIEEIEEYVEGCRYQPLSTTKIIVNKEELEELLRELRLKTPDEIKRYQRIIENRDAILSDAQAKADALLNDAEEKARKLVSETEIIKEAYAQADATLNDANQQAQDILDSAQQDANDIRTSAITYTDSLLSSISEVMSNTIQDVGQSYNDFAGALTDYYNVVVENRKELSPIAGSDNAADDYEEEAEDDEYYEDDEYENDESYEDEEYEDEDEDEEYYEEDDEFEDDEDE